MTQPNWPAKKEHVTDKSMMTYYSSTNQRLIAFNQAIDDCIAAYEAANKPIHACKCRRHPDSAMTVRMLDEGKSLLKQRRFSLNA